MAAQGFLLIATFLLVLMVLARPLGSGLARLINDIPLPGTTGVERVLFSALGVSDREMNWKQYLSAILGLNILGLAVLFFMLLGAVFYRCPGIFHRRIHDLIQIKLGCLIVFQAVRAECIR